MKLTLEFDGITEVDEYESALNGSRFKFLIQDLDNELRKVTKYGSSIGESSKTATAKEVEIVEKVRKLLHDMADERGLKVWE